MDMQSNQTVSVVDLYFITTYLLPPHFINKGGAQGVRTAVVNPRLLSQ